MKILVCPDKFKESLAAPEVAKYICEGIMKVMPDAECKIIPMADGGEGTVDALVKATGGSIINMKVHDPLMRPVEAFFGISGDNTTAFIEMAAASGLALLEHGERNPLYTTTFGTGELIMKAVEHGLKKIVIGIGGSATIDGGVGMAQALGIKFLDERGKETGHGGKYLCDIRSIDNNLQDVRLNTCSFYAASDVRNVLTGAEGSAIVFGKQKGASSSDIQELDEGLKNLSKIIKRDLNIDVAELPGSGAAGGMGAGIVAFLNGKLQNGFELIAEITRLDDWIRWADIVITGEGKMDSQTAFGKTPAGVAQLALKHNKPVFGFVGALGDRLDKMDSLGFSAIIPVADKPMSLNQSMKEAGKLLENASERWMRVLNTGRQLRDS